MPRWPPACAVSPVSGSAVDSAVLAVLAAIAPVLRRTGDRW